MLSLELLSFMFENSPKLSAALFFLQPKKKKNLLLFAAAL